MWCEELESVSWIEVQPNTENFRLSNLLTTMKHGKKRPSIFFSSSKLVFRCEKCTPAVYTHHQVVNRERTHAFWDGFSSYNNNDQQWLTEECGKRWVVFFNNIKMIFDTNAKRIAFQINIKPIGSQSESLVGLCASALSWRFCQVLNTNNNCNRTVITTIDD